VHIGDLLHNIPERIYANVGSAASRPEGSFRATLQKHLCTINFSAASISFVVI